MQENKTEIYYNHLQIIICSNLNFEIIQFQDSFDDDRS